MNLRIRRYLLPLTIFMTLVDIVFLQATVGLEEGITSLTENPKVNEVETDTQTTISMLYTINAASSQNTSEQNGTTSEQNRTSSEQNGTSSEQNGTSTDLNEPVTKKKLQESKPSANETESNVKESVTNITKRIQKELSEPTDNSTVKIIQSPEEATDTNIKADVLTITENSSTVLTTTNNQKTDNLDLLQSAITELPVNNREVFINQNIDIRNQTANNYTKILTNITEDYSNMKYILQWSQGYYKPFEIKMNAGRQIFINRNCSFTNCIITKTKYLLGDYTKFDAVVFFAKDLIKFRRTFGVSNLPRRRSPHQKYVFASLDYGQRYPASSNKFNGFFNWTWTYRLDSDMTWTHFIVKDMKGNIVAPSKDVQWMKKEDMLPVSHKLRKILIGKRKAVAWFDPCSVSASKIYPCVSHLSTRLKLNYGIVVHRFGKCWRKKCRVDENNEVCNEILRKDFHFYLAFEEQINDDFVTGNVLRAYNNTVVPIVLGGANYSRFLPEGSYVDATELTIGALAKHIYQLLMDFEQYAAHFKWTNHYTFHTAKDDPQTDHICKVCEMMNDEKRLKEDTVIGNFTGWWGKAKHKKIKRIPKVKFTDQVSRNTPKQKHVSPFVKFIAKTARALSTIAKGIATDVKHVWSVLTGRHCSTCH